MSNNNNINDSGENYVINTNGVWICRVTHYLKNERKE